MRDDLAEAHRLAWEHIASPGSWWSGAERVELAGTALMAIADDDPVAAVGRHHLNRAAWPTSSSRRLRLTTSPTVSPVTRER